MKIKYIIYILLIAGLGTLVASRIVKNKKKGGTEMAGGNRGGGGQPMSVNGVVVQPQKFANAIFVSGSIEANEQVQIRSQVSGIVEGIFFKEGTKVKKGERLLQINDDELRAQLEQVKAREKLSSENEKRARQLLEKEGISQQEYDVAAADFNSLRAQTRLIEAQVGKTTIKAPFDGTIGLRGISTGGYLTPETVIANLVNINPVKITFSIPEKYSGKVKVGTELNFTVPGTTKKFSAKVYAVEPSIEATTRTLQLRALSENNENDLYPGAFANIELPIDVIDDALLVPTESIVPVQNGKKVFVSKNGKAMEVKVETSVRTEKEVLITSGLNPGDTVITTGVMSLKSETPVKVEVGKS
jgi:membrane fusion protein, multidrug efflux system